MVDRPIDAWQEIKKDIDRSNYGSHVSTRTHPLGKIKRSSSLTVNNGPDNQIEHEREYRMPTSKWTEIERMQQSGR
jgi:hypothetical protein